MTMKGNFMGLLNITLRSQRDGMLVVFSTLTFLSSSRWVLGFQAYTADRTPEPNEWPNKHGKFEIAKMSSANSGVDVHVRVCSLTGS